MIGLEDQVKARELEIALQSGALDRQRRSRTPSRLALRELAKTENKPPEPPAQGGKSDAEQQ